MLVHIFFDGAARQNPGPAAGAAIVLTPDGDTLTHRAEALGETTNNVAEWTGLLLGLRAARELGATDVVVHGDSKLVLNQAFGTWSVSERFSNFHAEATQLVAAFGSVEAKHVPRADNAAADRLCNAALDGTYRPFGEPCDPQAAAEARVSLTFTVSLRVSKSKATTGAAIRKQLDELLKTQFPLAGVSVTRL